MRDIDPHLVRLREYECRAALMEFHLQLQEETIADLRRRGFDTALAVDLRDSMGLAIEAVRQVHAQLLASMDTTAPPAMAECDQDRGKPRPERPRNCPTCADRRVDAWTIDEDASPTLSPVVEAVQFALLIEGRPVKALVTSETLVSRFQAEDSPAGWLSSFERHRYEVIAAVLDRYQFGDDLVIVNVDAFRPLQTSDVLMGEVAGSSFRRSKR